MSKADEASRTLTIQRTLNAPIDVVWEAWTQPSHIARWWGPKGLPVRIVSHDFRKGGKWKYTMTMPNGQEFVTEGEYLEIEKPTRIVTTADFKPMTEGVTLQVLLEAKGDQTLFTFNVIHPTKEYCNQQEKMGFYNGWGSTFTRLEEYLKSSLAGSRPG